PHPRRRRRRQCHRASPRSRWPASWARVRRESATTVLVNWVGWWGGPRGPPRRRSRPPRRPIRILRALRRRDGRPQPPGVLGLRGRMWNGPVLLPKLVVMRCRVGGRRAVLVVALAVASATTTTAGLVGTAEPAHAQQGLIDSDPAVVRARAEVDA